MTVVLASTLVVVLGGLVQVSFGAYSMTPSEAWRAVLNPDVVFNTQAWNAFLLGGEVPDMHERSLIAWNVRLPGCSSRSSSE